MSPMLPILPLALSHVGFAIGGKALLSDISFRLEGMGCTIVLGANGAGKSLLLRLCHGLLQPSQGMVSWTGPGAADAARRQAMVFQHPIMLRRSVAANVEVALKLRNIPAKLRPEMVSKALARGGLSQLAKRPARVLSGGEQQRLAVVRAAALTPQVLFLDEPTSSLDPSAARQIEDLIKGVQARQTRIVMTTHDLGQARRLADEVIFLHRGRLVEKTPAAEFFRAPRSPEAQAFLKGDLVW